MTSPSDLTDALDEAVTSLREQFAAATFPDGGLLLHLPSGDFFHLDRVAAAAWGAIHRGASAEAAINEIATALGVTAGAARAVLASVLAQASPLRDRQPVTSRAFWEDEHTLSLRQGPLTLLSLDKRTLTLAVTDDLRDSSDEEMTAAFRVFVPKIFGQWFPLAMHASAVTIRERTLLFCGESGAGKTTTARTIAEAIAGGRVLSEDVVVFREHDGVLMMIEGAESTIRSWMVELTSALLERKTVSHDVGALRASLAAEPRRLSIDKAIFLQADRRRGSTWSLGQLPRARAVERLFVHSFFPSPDARGLREHLAACRALAAQIAAADALAVPAGVAALSSASRAQIDTIAS